MTNSDQVTSIYITRVKLIYSAINSDAELGERNPPIAMSKPKPRGYWTKERCHEEAKRFNSRKAFQKGSTAYTRAHKAGWLDDICQHMSGGRVPNGYWTKQRCHDEAKKFLTRVEFENGSPAYQAALKNRWMDEICQHMTRLDHGRLHCTYVIKNERLNQAYIGITRNKFEKRMVEHRSENNRTLSKSITLESDTQFIQTSQYVLSGDEAALAERALVDEYKKNGWSILNDLSSIGALGNTRVKWTKRACAAEARKYTTRSEFRKNAPLAYEAALKKGWLSEIASHQTKKIQSGFWTREEILNRVSRYKNLKDFRTKETQAYSACVQKGWLDLLDTLTRSNKPNGYYTRQRCFEIASQYSTRVEFEKAMGSAYTTAASKGWLAEICSHMVPASRVRKWTFEACLKEASQYLTRVEFKRANESAYNTAASKGWLAEICSHMVPASRVRKWTFEACLKEASQYSTRVEFRDNAPGAYAASLKNGWHTQICKHMKAT